MAKQLKYVAQEAMDNFFASYRADFQFFDLDDFIRYTGNAVTKIYQTYYETQYKELRADRKDEIVTFDTGMLSEQIAEVENKDGVLIAKCLEPFMSFMWDQQNTAIQDVIIIEPAGSQELERTTLAAKWQLNYMPKTNKIWWYPEIKNIYFVNKGTCNIKKVKILYIPEMYPEALIADGIIQDAIAATVLMVRQLTDKTVVKKTLDNNENLILPLEASTNLTQ